MSFTIREPKNIEEDIDIIIEYFNSHSLTDEKQIDSQIKKLRKAVQENKTFIFYAYLGDKAIGFISGSKQWLVLEVKAFYVKEEGFAHDCSSKLIIALTEKAFDSGLKYFRYYHSPKMVLEQSFEDNLKKNGYWLIPRYGMRLDLTTFTTESIELQEKYSIVPFSFDYVDDMMKVMVKANAGDHSDLKIYPSMGDAKILKKIFGSFSDDFKVLEPSLNPQIKFKDEIIGMSTVVKQNPETAFIAEIALDPEHQRKGLGKALMKKIIVECKNAGCKTLGLAVTEDNIGAVKLYKKLGFKVVNNTTAIIKHN